MPTTVEPSNTSPSHLDLSKALPATVGFIIGTGITLYASGFPDKSGTRTAITSCAPAVTLLVTSLLTAFLNHIGTLTQRRKSLKAYAATRTFFLDSINDPHTSEEHKATLKALLEEHEITYARLEMDRTAELLKESSSRSRPT